MGKEKIKSFQYTPARYLISLGQKRVIHRDASTAPAGTEKTPVIINR